MLKLVIGVVFILAMISLSSGFFFLMKDQKGSRRLLNSLKLRVGLCLLFVALVVYGFWSGQLISHSPWGQIHS